MKRAGARVGVGTRFDYDGEVIEIVEVHTIKGAPEVLTTDLRTQMVRRFALSELMFSERSRLLSEDMVIEAVDSEGDIATVKWLAAPEPVRRQARERAAHVREALTGYRSGSAETAVPGEPRPRYTPTLPKQARMAAKAKELHIGLRTFERWVCYEEAGEVDSVSGKAVQPELGSETFRAVRTGGPGRDGRAHRRVEADRELRHRAHSGAPDGHLWP